MLKLNLQYFGGRGAVAPEGPPPAVGSDGRDWAGSLGAPIDATLSDALGKKGRAMSADRAALGANPNHHYEYREYSQNCQRCIIATEARMRGYDVTAHATYKGDTMPRGNNYANNFKNAKIDAVGSRSKTRTEKNIEKQMKSYGEGSRAVITVQWKGGRSGHVANVVTKNGKVWVYDGQVGMRFTLTNFLKNTASEHTTLTRVDNLDFSDYARNSVTTFKHR